MLDYLTKLLRYEKIFVADIVYFCGNLFDRGIPISKIYFEPSILYLYRVDILSVYSLIYYLSVLVNFGLFTREKIAHHDYEL